VEEAGPRTQRPGRPEAAVRAGVRSIEHGSLMDDEGIRLMKEHGTWLVADIWNGDYIASEGKKQGWPEEILRKNDETTEAQRIAFRKAVAAGVHIAFGTDSSVYPHGLNASQLPHMVRYGMTPMMAIQSATLRAAEFMGWQDRVGSLAPGKFADLLTLRTDPSRPRPPPARRFRYESRHGGEGPWVETPIAACEGSRNPSAPGPSMCR
jgi:imidazolonepropionase-like amidohydrolase